MFLEECLDGVEKVNFFNDLTFYFLLDVCVCEQVARHIKTALIHSTTNTFEFFFEGIESSETEWTTAARNNGNIKKHAFLSSGVIFKFPFINFLGGLIEDLKMCFDLTCTVFFRIKIQLLSFWVHYFSP